MPIWTEAVKAAIRRHVAQTGSAQFSRRAFFDAELDAIKRETGTTGLTPTQTSGRELQQLRDEGLIAFVERGRYRWLEPMPEPEPTTPSKAVFLLHAYPRADDPPELGYGFPAKWRNIARRTVGQWIVYQDPSGYQAVAEVRRIERDPRRADGYRAEMAPNTYLEFGRVVPLDKNSVPVDRQPVSPIRTISDDEFDRILAESPIGDEEILPRSDAGGLLPQFFADERIPWDEPVERATMLVSRPVRSQQFRRRVLDVYGSRCALTGMKFINGGGRAETEAAHIKSVEAGGPDSVRNGIALAGTIHWMFDRGLISLGDAGEILLSRKINDRASIERLVFPDLRARLPMSSFDRPDPRYLAWHRSECFHG